MHIFLSLIFFTGFTLSAFGVGDEVFNKPAQEIDGYHCKRLPRRLWGEAKKIYDVFKEICERKDIQPVKGNANTKILALSREDSHIVSSRSCLVSNGKQHSFSNEFALFFNALITRDTKIPYKDEDQRRVAIENKAYNAEINMWVGRMLEASYNDGNEYRRATELEAFNVGDYRENPAAQHFYTYFIPSMVIEAERNNPYALFIMGLTFLDGIGCNQDPARGLTYIRRAAAGSYGTAATCISEIYETCPDHLRPLLDGSSEEWE